MRKLVIVLVLLLVATLALALPPQLSQKGNPALYKKLESKAKLNIKKLPSAQKKAYAKLLKQHPDILMAYLLAYESDANLAIAKAAYVESNYATTAALLEKEGLRYSAEFFLSYVAKQTVSDDPITAYRAAFLEDGLQNVINTTTTDIDRYRATTLWCVSRLQFQQTSGRDQSPLDITQKSLIGRCEEMQILFVAAARAVGLPSRPASTPWWAHMDNNHAWAEVFLDGAWHYTGDMDGAWFPDQTWFSGMIDKTVLILADGSLASENDEILGKGKYDTLINSTRNYAKERSRTIKLTIIDTEGKPVPSARVMPMVFNWGSLRALAMIEADKDGKLEFTAGRGAFFISVYAEGKKALEYIPSNSEELTSLTVTATNDEFTSVNCFMEYPGNPMEWGTPPDSYKEAVNKEKDLWQQKVKAFESEITRQPLFSDSLLIEVAKACRGNHPAFAGFVQKAEVINPEFLNMLLIGDPKFLWQASSEQFEALYENWLWFDQDEWGEEARLSLYSPAVFYEELPRPVEYKDGKAQLYPEALRFDGMFGREDIISILAKLKKKYKINPAKALSGLLPLDVALQQKYLTSVQFRIMACSILRANGYPAEFSRIPDLISVYLVDDWLYVNVAKLSWEDQSATKEAQTFTLHLQIADEKGLPIKVNEEQLTLCRYVEGSFYPLNNSFEYLGDGSYRGVFPASNAYLQLGYRVSDSRTGFYFQPISAQAGDSLSVNLNVAQYPRTWKAAEEQLLSLIDDSILSAHSIIILGNHDQENSRRIADKLDALSISYLWLGYQESSNPPKGYSFNANWEEAVNTHPINAMRSITLIKTGDDWQMYEGLWDKLPE